MKNRLVEQVQIIESPRLVEFDGLWDETTVAKYLRLSVGHIRNLRVDGKGPRFLKFQSKVRYRKADVDKWVDEHIQDPNDWAS